MAAGNEAVLYKEVKAWISQQEAFEAEHNVPAHLTHAQRRALEALRPPVSHTTGTVNYVGLLQGKGGGKAQKGTGHVSADRASRPEHRQKNPLMGDIVYTEEASSVLAGGTTGRVCRVTIAESLAARPGSVPIESFPAAGGYGLAEDTGKPRIFPTKKAAKQFAAQCAVEWLVAKGLFLSDLPIGTVAGAGVGTLKRPPASLGGTTTTTHGASPPAKRQSIAQVPPAAPDGSSSRIEDPRPVVESQATYNNCPAPAPAASSRPATELVVGLCKDLNINPPRYRFSTSTTGAGNTFDVLAEFEDYGDKELEELRGDSAVKDVVGRERARQAVAENLLPLLRKIEAFRDAQLKSALDETDGDGDGDGAAV